MRQKQDRPQAKDDFSLEVVQKAVARNAGNSVAGEAPKWVRALLATAEPRAVTSAVSFGNGSGAPGRILEIPRQEVEWAVLKPALRSFAVLHKREKVSFLAIVTARIIVQGLDVAGLAAVGLIATMLTGGLNNQTEAAFLGISVSLNSNLNYIWVVVAIALFFISKSIVAVFLLRLTSRFLAIAEATASSDIARYLFAGSIYRVRSRSRGEIQWLVTQSTEQAFSIVLFAGATVITEFSLLAAIFATFIVIDAGTAFFLAGFFAAFVVAFQLLVSKRLHSLGEGTARFARNTNNSVLDLTTAFREAAVLGKRNWFLERFDKSRLGYAKNKGTEKFVVSFPRYLIEMALVLCILALISWQFVFGAGLDSLVVIGVFLAGGTRMMAALLPLQNAVSQLRVSGPQAERAQDLISKARKEAQSAKVSNKTRDDRESDEGDGIAVYVDGVSFVYPDSSEKVLGEVSLRIEPGQFAAFVGPSGAGKTTLADLILGIHDPAEGMIAIGGMSPLELRAVKPGAVSYVPQNPGMVSGTLAQNVALGIEVAEIDDDRVWAVLDQVGLSKSIKAMPEGIHTSLGEQSDALSGGQIQRIGIARALYTRPRLLVLDEATSALDAETEAVISQTLDRLHGETTVIVIAHRLSTIQHADLVFVIDGGQVVSSGTFPEVRKATPLIEKYVQLMTIEDLDSESP